MTSLSPQAVKSLEDVLSCARDDRLGYLTFCPSNLGTTLRASVHIKIPLLSARKDFKATCDKLKLQARGTSTSQQGSQSISQLKQSVTQSANQQSI